MDRPRPPVLLLVAAFAAVYVIWGSTYLAIRFAVETLPPFLMAGARWIPAGVALYAWARWRGAPRPTLANWRSATVVGVLLIVGGNGGVTWAEQWVPSGLAALLVATVPLWIVVLEWARRGGVRPTAVTVGGIALGLAGVGILVGPETILRGDVRPIGVVAILGAALSWAFGSLYSRRAALPENAFMSSAMEMLAGGVALIALGLVTGEGARLDVANASARSLWSLAYLATFGSVVAFSAYVWLLKTVPAERATTYAFVNPVVAVILGWLLASEPITMGTLAATVLIVAGVALIVTRKTRPPTAAAGPAATVASEPRG